MRITEGIDLPVSCDDAWRFLMDWEGQAAWMSDAAWVRVRGAQREGVGTRIEVKTLLYGIPAFVEPMVVSAWEPPHRLGISHGSIVKGTGQWDLEPRPAGCRFTWTEDVGLRVPLVGAAVARIYGRFLRRLMRGALERVASQVVR